MQELNWSAFMGWTNYGVTLEEDGTIRIGSLTSFSHITKDPVIQKYMNVLGEAVDMVGGPQIRNIGTIGGNTCNGVTSQIQPPHYLRGCRS